jgi:ABC-type nitrate/sulfonate/bicarbonate transport system substrate-binding protein
MAASGRNDGQKKESKVMRYKIVFSGLLFCVEVLASIALSRAASSSEKVRIGYPAFTGAYAPLWIAAQERLGKKYGFDLEAIYGGRTSPRLLLESGAVRYTVSYWIRNSPNARSRDKRPPDCRVLFKYDRLFYLFEVPSNPNCRLER